jgi:hypothetical protein
MMLSTLSAPTFNCNVSAGLKSIGGNVVYISQQGTAGVESKARVLNDSKTDCAAKLLLLVLNRPPHL